MNAAVRAVVRMGIYVGCKVYLIKEVNSTDGNIIQMGKFDSWVKYDRLGQMLLTLQMGQH